MDERMIVAVCPKCQVVYELPAEYIGQQAECTDCNTLFDITGCDTVPEGAEVNATQVEFDDSPDQQPQEQRKKEQTQVISDRILDDTPVPAPDTTSAMEETSTISKDDFSEQTNTVKLSRAKVGMVPTVKDNFKVGLLQTSSTHSISSGTISSTRRKKFARSFSSKSNPSIDHSAVPPKKKRWWEFWK